MEPKNSSSQHQLHVMESKGKKTSPHGVVAADKAESSISSLFNPPSQWASGKDPDLYRILYKGKSGSEQAEMADAQTKWSSPKSGTTYNKDDKNPQKYDSVDTSCFGSSVHYGGRDYYGGSSTMQTNKYCNMYVGDKKDSATDSHGDWWRGSFYY